MKYAPPHPLPLPLGERGRVRGLQNPKRMIIFIGKTNRKGVN